MLIFSKPNNYLRKIDEIAIQTLTELHQQRPEKELENILMSKEFKKKIQNKRPDITTELLHMRTQAYLCLLVYNALNVCENDEKN